MRNYRELREMFDQATFSELRADARDKFFKLRYSTNGRYDDKTGQRRHQRSGPGIPRCGMRHFVLEEMQHMARKRGYAFQTRAT